MHIHTLRLQLPSKLVTCDGCDVDLRLATHDEAVWVQNNAGLRWPDGPLLFNDNGVIVVPYDFSLQQEDA